MRESEHAALDILVGVRGEDPPPEADARPALVILTRAGWRGLAGVDW